MEKALQKCVRVCVRACGGGWVGVRACVRARARVCVCEREREILIEDDLFFASLGPDVCWL